MFRNSVKHETVAHHACSSQPMNVLWDLYLSLLREATIETQLASTVYHQQQEAADDRNVLKEHDHLDLVGKVGVEHQRRQQRVPCQEEGANAGLPAEDDGRRAEHFGGDDDRK